MSTPLRLKAEDAEDLRVIAACLQDALLPVRDLSWLPDEQRFVMVANRFLWETPLDAGGSHERTLAAVTFGSVTNVRFRGIDRRDGDALLSLLDLAPVEGGIDLIFSGKATIRLEAAVIDVYLGDLAEPWPTGWRPGH